MRKAIFHFCLITLVICLPNLRSIAQGNQSSAIKSPISPTFAPYSSVAPNTNQPNNRNPIFTINPAGIQRNQQSQFRKANQDLFRQQQQPKGTNEELNHADQESKYSYYLRNQKLYKTAFDQLMAMNNDSFSVTLAVFLIENAFFENELSYEKFLKAIQKKVNLCRAIIRSEKLNPNDNLAKNYAIQKLFSGGAKIYDKRTKTWQPVKPFLYDFEDFRAEKDWTKMFVTKLLQTGKGQCHSLPRMYSILTEQLDATAWLSTAPEHSYIKFPSNNGNIYNFETTQGKIVSDQAIVMSGYITPTAIKNKIYMDTLSRQRLLAELLVDLVQSYREKIKGYDTFTESIIDQILYIDPNNIMALAMKADIKSFQFENAANNIGRPPIDRLADYPEIYKLYQERNDLYAQIDNSGYEAMPAEVYQQWLQSLKQEQQKQESKGLQEEIKRMLMSPGKPTLTNKKN